MSDSPKDESKAVTIIDKATGAVSRGEPRGKQASKAESQPAEVTSPSASPAASASDDTQPGSAENMSEGTDKAAIASQEQPAPSSAPSEAKPKRAKGVSRVYDIIKRFYASSGTPKRIAETDLKKLEERSLSATQRQELLDLAKREDESLARTVNLAFAAFEIHSNRTIKDLLLKFAVDAGREGFDLALENVDAWLPLTDEERPPAKEHFRRYAARAEQIASSKEMPAKEKKERQAKLRNLLFLSLIWQADQGWAREEEILRFLRADGVFTTSTHYPTQAMEALLKAAYTQNTADFSPLGWLSRQIDNTKASQSSELERLERDVKRLAGERDQARQDHAALRHEHDALLSKVGELEQSLHQEKQNAQTTSVHLEDDKHRLRSQVTKALKSEVPRLEEALVALRLDPPKLHIVSHYVEDALDNIKKVLNRTEGE